MDVVVVESPAKAKTIEKYLGDGYIVLASYGHVRDLPSKDGSVLPENGFSMRYQTDPRSAKHMTAIANAARKANCLYLATDPDREGEAISWHVLEALREDHGIEMANVRRVVFNQITKSAVAQGMDNPRDLDMDLINAQQARRALDYLVGFTLSPVLWRKLPGARSAGRVQSVALRLVCQRELEIEAFVAQEYWTVDADFETGAGGRFRARLTYLDGAKLEKFDLPSADTAKAAKARIESGRFSVLSVATKPTRRHPQPPFTTSTLQQEASRKLGFGARRTMQTAQRLYEGLAIGGETGGLITYMRTDGVQIAGEALSQCRNLIAEKFGAAFLPQSPRQYRAKAKNAQEAHEAIRPTDLTRLPDDVAPYLDNDQRRLYELIWKRTMASQMEIARLARTTIDVADADNATRLRATGSVIEFAGFLRLYEEGRDDQKGGDDDDRRLPKVSDGERLDTSTVLPEQHFTEPPPRYNEATLVKKLEELGIGRPSTYASILSVLQERTYVRLERGRFIPDDKGLLVTAFLESFFRRYVEYDFTANLEDRLDDISGGRVAWKVVLEDFWREFSAAVEETQELRIRDVLDAVDAVLAPHLYPDVVAGENGRACPTCGEGRLSLKGGRHGFFLGCSNYPECRFTRALKSGDDDERAGEVADGPRDLGRDAASGLDITLCKGPYGLYLQLGEADPETPKEKPKRASLPKDLQVDDLSLELASALLHLPRDVGEHPETGAMIRAGLGRYGPFLLMDGGYTRLNGTHEMLEIGLNLAVTRIAEAGQKGGNRRGPRELKNLGVHPDDGAPILIMDGRYGPYVKHQKINATIPSEKDPDDVTLDDAVALIAARAARGPAKRKKKAGSKKKSAASKKKAGAAKKNSSARKNPSSAPPAS